MAFMTFGNDFYCVPLEIQIKINRKYQIESKTQSIVQYFLV